MYFEQRAGALHKTWAIRSETMFASKIINIYIGYSSSIQFNFHGLDWIVFDYDSIQGFLFAIMHYSLDIIIMK